MRLIPSVQGFLSNCAFRDRKKQNQPVRKFSPQYHLMILVIARGKSSRPFDVCESINLMLQVDCIMFANNMFDAARSLFSICCPVGPHLMIAFTQQDALGGSATSIALNEKQIIIAMLLRGDHKPTL